MDGLKVYVAVLAVAVLIGLGLLVRPVSVLASPSVITFNFPAGYNETTSIPTRYLIWITAEEADSRRGDGH